MDISYGAPNAYGSLTSGQVMTSLQMVMWVLVQLVPMSNDSNIQMEQNFYMTKIKNTSTSGNYYTGVHAGCCWTGAL